MNSCWVAECVGLVGVEISPGAPADKHAEAAGGGDLSRDPREAPRSEERASPPSLAFPEEGQGAEPPVTLVGP